MKKDLDIKFGPAGLGAVKTAEEVLEVYAGLGLKACEIAFTYSVYIKDEKDMKRIGLKAEKLGIELSIHAPYFVNLNSSDSLKVKATKERILKCCEVGEKMGAKVVVFHPGFYGAEKELAFGNIRARILEMMDFLKRRKWKIKLAPETMGKVNVFGSAEEISELVKETGCSFCLDFAHILAREKKIDFVRLGELFPQKKWHCHFSGIEYGEKGERRHKSTGREDWEKLFRGLPEGKGIVIINESPTMVEDCVEGLRVLKTID